MFFNENRKYVFFFLSLAIASNKFQVFLVRFFVVVVMIDILCVVNTLNDLNRYSSALKNRARPSYKLIERISLELITPSIELCKGK